MARANYQYEIRIDDTTKQKAIIIVDQNTVGMSVTNDIEDVIEEICLQNNLNSPLVNVVYRDSEGIWDGYNTKQKDFIHLGAATSQEAIIKLNNLKSQ